MDKCREEFERWINENAIYRDPVWIESIQNYNYTSTQLMWKAWQASRAAIKVELPCWVLKDGKAVLYHDDVITMLNDIGITYE